MKFLPLLLALAFACGSVPMYAQAQAAPGAPATADDNDNNSLDDYGDYDAPRISDPFETLNRGIFHFNDFVYENALWPTVRVYEKAVPQGVRTGLGSFFDNLAYPVRLVGSLLQGKFARAGQETGKFIVNSTIGMAGFFRLSDQIPQLAAVPAEDLGQAFGSWGIGNGPYLVLPIVGGMSTRDLFGRIGDAVIYPLGWQYPEWGNREWTRELGWEWNTGLTTADILNQLPPSLHLYRDFKGNALDPYTAFRDGLISYRDEQVKR